jgi:hypothetical protein
MASQYMGGTSRPSNLASYYKLASGSRRGRYAGGPASYRGAPRATTRAAARRSAGAEAGPGVDGERSPQLAQAANAAANPPKPPPDRYEGIGKIDYSSDPVLAQVRLLGQQAVPDAIAQADAARKQLLIAYGDPNLARSAVFGGKGFTCRGSRAARTSRSLTRRMWGTSRPRWRRSRTRSRRWRSSRTRTS